jgi:hypothetical protein
MGADGLYHGRSEAICAGQARARAAGKQIGRPRKLLCQDLITELRGQGLSWREIARRTGAGVGTVRRAVGLDSSLISACQNSPAGNLQASADPQDEPGALSTSSLDGRSGFQQHSTLLSSNRWVRS